jgi:hypothetical protein
MRVWLISFSDHHWAMGSVYKVRISSDLEVNVSTGQDSKNCWIVLDLVRMNGVKRERSTEQRSN